MASAAALDAQQYAEALRKSLMDGLFEGEELDEQAADGAAGPDAVGQLLDASAGAAAGAGGGLGSLADLEAELTALGGHEVVRSILDQGCVLGEYRAGLEAKLAGLEAESIADYLAESDNLVALHGQIQAVDAVLGHMEGLLSAFQGDLGDVSDEIRSLQVQSSTMSARLASRRRAEDKLGRFLESALLSQELIDTLLHAPVDEEYVEACLLLGRKLAFLGASPDAAGSAAAAQLAGVADKLRVAAVVKVRDFLLSKLAALRKPKTNACLIQQTVLLKHKHCARFLEAHAPHVHAELRGEYVAVMSRSLAGQLRSYSAALERLAAPVAGPLDVLGVVPDGGGLGGSISSISSGVSGVGSSVMALFGGRPGAGGKGGVPTERVFELGERLGVLSQLSQPPLVPHMAEVDGHKLPYEVVFRNVQRLLVDAACSEFLFCVDFWENEDAFASLYAPVVAGVEADLAAQLQEQHDVLCVLLMLRLNAQHRALLASRHVHCLDDHFDRVALALWPRFKVLYDVQVASLRPGCERALFPGTPQVAGVTRRYAALCGSCLTLMAGADADDGVFKASSFSEAAERLWASLFDTLLRLSNMFKERRQGIVFLILNYSHIKAVLHGADAAAARLSAASGASGSGGAPGAQQQQQQQAQQQQQPPDSPLAGRGALGSAGAVAIKECEDQLGAVTSLYVEDQLGAHFKSLLEYVKKGEQAQKRAGLSEGQPIPGYGPDEARPVLADFSARWQGAIAAVTREVAGQISDAACAREVLQASMTQLLLYYTRLLELLKRQGPPGQALVRQAVNVPSIMYEIKRLTKV